MIHKTDRILWAAHSTMTVAGLIYQTSGQSAQLATSHQFDKISNNRIALSDNRNPL
jgi:hypothetical protein